MRAPTGSPPGRRRSSRTGLRALVALLALVMFRGVAAELSLNPPEVPESAEIHACDLDDPIPSIWLGEPGAGFRSTVQTVSLLAGGAVGPAMMGSQEHHHLALVSVAYGQMFAPLQAEDHWWRGNFEARLELFGGIQVAPEHSWLVGIAPHLRYHLATGSRWTPFIDAGAGFTLTDIGAPDVGNLFEFNLQGTIGVHYHWRDDLALTFEARYMHLSNAGISADNYGVNALVAVFGVTRFF